MSDEDLKNLIQRRFGRGFDITKPEPMAHTYRETRQVYRSNFEQIKRTFESHTVYILHTQTSIKAAAIAALPVGSAPLQLFCDGTLQRDGSQYNAAECRLLVTSIIIIICMGLLGQSFDS